MDALTEPRRRIIPNHPSLFSMVQETAEVCQDEPDSVFRKILPNQQSPYQGWTSTLVISSKRLDFSSSNIAERSPIVSPA